MWEYETLEPWEYFKIKKADWQKWINNQWKQHSQH
jgi:hypothetical protein